MKDIEAIRDRLVSQLQDPTGKGLLLTGPWGCGKTYLWKQLVAPALAKDRPLYVSLFGMDTLMTLKRTLMTASLSRRASQLKGKEFKKAGSALPTLLFAGLKEGLGRIAKSDLIARVDPLELTEDDLIICLDDVERASKTLPIAEILGFTTVLAETKGCRVLLLANESHILERDDPEETFRKYRERAVAGHLAVTADVGRVADRMTQDTAQRAGIQTQDAERYKLATLSVFQRANCQNLRSLQRALHDAMYLASLAGSERIQDRHVRFLAALRIEADLGSLQPPGLYKAMETGVLLFFEKKELTADQVRMAEFRRKYIADDDAITFSRSAYELVAQGYTSQDAVDEDFATWARTAADDMFDEIQSTEWMFYSDQETADLVDRIGQLLGASEPIKTAQVIHLFVVAHLATERMGATLPPDVENNVKRRLASNAEKQDRSFDHVMRFSLENQEKIWGPLLNVYEVAVRRSESVALGRVLDETLARADMNSFADLILKKPRHLETLLNEKLGALHATLGVNRRFHYRAVGLVGDELSAWTQQIVPDLFHLRQLFTESLASMLARPDLDRTDRARVTNLRDRFASW